jgi:hypothetical protein
MVVTQHNRTSSSNTGGRSTRAICSTSQVGWERTYAQSLQHIQQGAMFQAVCITPWHGSLGSITLAGQLSVPNDMQVAMSCPLSLP